MASRSDAEELMDRPVFWAELSLVSSPSLLARLGNILCEDAKHDAELGAALDLAIAHVQRGCSVWRAPRPDRGAAPEIAQDPRVQNLALVPGAALAESIADDASASSDLAAGPADCGLSSSEELLSRTGCSCSVPIDEDPTGLYVFEDALPWPILPCCFPGLGGPVARAVWVAVMFALAVAGSFFEVRQDEGVEAYRVAVFNGIEVAVLIMNVALLFSLSRLVQGRAFREAFLEQSDGCPLYQQVASLPGDACRTKLRDKFVRTAAVNSCIFSFVLLMWEIFVHFGPCREKIAEDYFRSVELFMWCTLLRQLVSRQVQGSFMLVFLSMRRLTQSKLADIMVTLEGAEGATDWVTLTRQYVRLHNFLNTLWGESGFNIAVILFLVQAGLWSTNALFVALFARSLNLPRTFDRAFVALAFNAVLMAALVFNMALVDSKFRSKSPSKRSMCFSAAERYGVTRADPLPHHIFVQCLEKLPLGIELRPFGLITKSKATLIVRLVAVGLPAFYRFADRLVASEA